MSVVVHEANVHDSVGADGVIDKMKGCFPRLKKMLADGGYKGRKLSEEILRAATPMYCGALFLLVGKLSKNCH